MTRRVSGIRDAEISRSIQRAQAQALADGTMVRCPYCATIKAVRAAIDSHIRYAHKEPPAHGLVKRIQRVWGRR